MWKDENGYVYTEEDLFNMALEECHSEDSAYDYIDTLIAKKEFGGNLIMIKIECEFCECEDRQNCYRCVDPHLNDNWDFKCKCDRRQQCLCGDWF